MAFSLDYDRMLFLDAEDLAEGGIQEAYDRIVPELSRYITGSPAEIEELLDNDRPSYSVKCRGVEYLIHAPGVEDDEGQSWGRAEFALFKIVNDQLAGAACRFYAINGGNDLSGMFLTQAECDAARRSLLRKTDWPYLPTSEHPWYGQFHD